MLHLLGVSDDNRFASKTQTKFCKIHVTVCTRMTTFRKVGTSTFEKTACVSPHAIVQKSLKLAENSITQFTHYLITVLQVFSFDW